MLLVRELDDNDIPVIHGWPPYPDEFRDLDYALRKGGWIDEYHGRPGTTILVAMEREVVIGFSVLAVDPDHHQAEFRIALHPEQLGHGCGREIALHTLRYGFMQPAVDRIRLIVRKNNPRARRLYESLHFHRTGECIESIQGKPVEFFTMEIDRAQFLEANKK